VKKLESQLKKIFSDICRGYSIKSWQDEKIFIKHLNHHDQVDIDDFYQNAFDAALARKIRTEEQQLKWLKDKKLWSDKDESSLSMQKVYIENLEKTKSKLIFKAQIDQVGKDLDTAKQKYYEDLNRKNELVGLTAERVADQKMQYEYLRLSCFKDAELKKYMFTRRQMENLSDEEAYNLMDLYMDVIIGFGPKNLKQIALAPYFTNSFYLCGDNHFGFFNKAMCDLTMYQSNLLSYGIYYKNILTTTENIPSDVKDDPDKLEEFVNRGQNLKKMMEKTQVGGGRIGLVASPEDFKALNIQDSTQQMNNIASKGYTDARKAAQDMAY
jgi:hypothetical protein